MIRIAPCSANHAAGVAALILPIQREEFGLPIALADQPDLLDLAGFYGRGASRFWVALAGDDVVGTIALLDIGAGHGALRKMFVAKDHRGGAHGVAARLLDALHAHARAADLETIWLGTTARFLAAHRFYEKHGYREVDKTALPPAFPVMAVDTKFYARRLTPAT